MNEYLNTLYITRERGYVHLDHDTLRLELNSQTIFRMPLLHLSSIVCFGDILLSPAFIHRCADDGRSLVFLDAYGRFKARLEGACQGNVLLRRAQHRVHNEHPLEIARTIVAAKIQNCRQILLRARRESCHQDDADRLSSALSMLEVMIGQLEQCQDMSELLGHEGMVAKTYFAVFSCMIKVEREAFAFRSRTRRPPLDRINALLSFLYTLLCSDCISAVESVGLDPQIGFLHTVRPGRPALALDLMEEFRAIMADRLALSLINRKQIDAQDFVDLPGGAVYLTDEARKKIVRAYQERKKDEVHHRVLGKNVSFGLLPFIQARLLARTLRDDVSHYLPFLYR